MKPPCCRVSVCLALACTILLWYLVIAVLMRQSRGTGDVIILSTEEPMVELDDPGNVVVVEEESVDEDEEALAEDEELRDEDEEFLVEDEELKDEDKALLDEDEELRDEDEDVMDEDDPEETDIADDTSVGDKGRKPVEPSRTSKACVQAERLYAINQYCKSHPELQDVILDPRSPLDPYRKFVVDKKHNILLCQVPKAAGSFWRTMFVRGAGVDEDDEDINVHRQQDLKSIGLEFLHKFDPEEQKKILGTYLKVMTVRHPLERALSAYIDKFVASRIREPIMDCINYINKHYRSKNNQIVLKNGDKTIPSGVTLHDFIRLVLDSKSPYNPHWDMAFNLCHPCSIQYDYVIRTETIQEDADHILKILSSELETPLQMEIVHSRRNNTVDDVLNPTFAKVLEEYKVLPKEDLENLKAVYKLDMDVFGYDFHVPSHEALCAYDQHVKVNCC